MADYRWWCPPLFLLLAIRFYSENEKLRDWGVAPTRQNVHGIYRCPALQFLNIMINDKFKDYIPIYKKYNDILKILKIYVDVKRNMK